MIYVEEIIEKVKKENPNAGKAVLQARVGYEVNKQKVQAMYQSGYKVSEICKIMDLQESTVRNLLRDVIVK